MVRYKISAVLIAVFFVSSASAMSFNVGIEGLTSSSQYNIQYDKNVSLYQDINTTIENTGSIGCTFRLKSEFNYNNKTFTRFSQGYELWPGATQLARIRFIPLNYTGPVETSLYTNYCDQEKLLKEFTFNMRENITVNETIVSTAREVTDDYSRIEVNTDNGYLVPQEAPSYWKTGSAEIVNGTATVEYDAPIFRKGENITYTVVSNGKVVGETKVTLEEPEKTPWQNLKENMAVILLTLSFALNAAILLLKLENWKK